MHLLNPRDSSEATLGTLFSAKYRWLMRWAMHFAQNDRSFAEDLVQETYVRILKFRNTLSVLDDIEPLLYTHLRYAYLTERRRGLTNAFLSLSAADFDTLAISLRTVPSFDQVERQNELRKILAFLLWRRRAAKFASFFILRFFHGFAPAEIANICLVSRHAVDLGLGNARQELKTYFANSEQLHVLGRGSVPDYKPINTAVPSSDFTHEILETIFDSVCGVCPSDAALERNYRTLNQRPLESELLAHIVSCKKCLGRITQLSNTPPPTPSMEDKFKPTRRAGKLKRQDTSEKTTVARIMARAEERVRESFEHRPSGLVIALNAEVVAVRDISSPSAVLKVETRSIENLNMIELFSEQGMLMLSLEILQRPPMAPPELRRDITLSGERTLTLVVRFTATGALIEATYLDPGFLTNVVEKHDLFEGTSSLRETGKIDAEFEIGDQESGAASIAPAAPWKQSRWSRFTDRVSVLWRARPLVPLAALGLLLACTILWVTADHQREQINAANLLNESVRAERHRRIQHGPGVIHQRVALRTTGHTLQRDIYRDIDSRRQPKRHPMDSVERSLREKLEQAGVDWDDPLSASGFQAWQDDQPEHQDQMKRDGSGLITLTTAVSPGPIVRESLTVRLSDLHPVARALYFRDQETIEVAELSYEVVPWGPASEEWFESTHDPSSSFHHRPANFRLPSGSSELSEAEIDMARLSVLLAFQKLHADTEGLSVTASDKGIAVTGIVENDARKSEITKSLLAIPHVTVKILSYLDVSSKPEVGSGITSVKAMSMVAGESPLHDQCAAQGILRDRCQQLAILLLNASATLVRESNRLNDLQRLYPPTKALSPQARVLLSELARVHIDHLAVAAGEEESALPTLGTERPPASNGATVRQTEINEAVQQNLRLAEELVYAGDEHTRSPALIIHDLETSAAEVRAAVSRIHVTPANDPAISSNTVTPHHD